jgi:folate-binding protein YgfZ
MTADLNPGPRWFFDLSARVKLRLTGVDCVRFLNGQITNDVRKATPATAIQASVLNAKGKMSAHVFISKDSHGAFLLDADAELRDELPARLERYIIADDVQIEDVTGGFSLFHFLAESPATGNGPKLTISSDRFGMAGWDCWFDPVDRNELIARFSDRFTFCDEAAAETFRMERGIARWGHELTSEIIPVEANLEGNSIDYAKGCYIGQEVISRMKISGQMNKRLCGLVSCSGAPLGAGMRLAREDVPDKEAGWVTSATTSLRLGKEIALGFVKRGSNDPGTRLLAQGIPVEVTALPFI